jgi:hypothetical protein
MHPLQTKKSIPPWANLEELMRIWMRIVQSMLGTNERGFGECFPFPSGQRWNGYMFSHVLVCSFCFFLFFGKLYSFCYDHGPITLVTTEMGCQQIKTSVVHTPSQVFFFLWLFGCRLTSPMPKIHGVHSICSSRGGGVGSVSLRS